MPIPVCVFLGLSLCLTCIFVVYIFGSLAVFVFLLLFYSVDALRNQGYVLKVEDKSEGRSVERQAEQAYRNSALREFSNPPVTLLFCVCIFFANKCDKFWCGFGIKLSVFRLLINLHAKILRYVDIARILGKRKLLLEYLQRAIS